MADLERLGATLRGDDTQATPRLRKGTVTAISGGLVTLTLAGDPITIPALEPSYAVGDDVWLALQDSSQWMVLGREAPAAGLPLAHEVHTQFWTTGTHNYSTSYQFVGSSDQLSFTKRDDGTRLIAHFSGSYRNTGTSTLVQHGVYLDDTADAIGRWEICRQYTQVNDPNHARTDGGVQMGTFGTYAAGSHSLSVGGKAGVATTIVTDNDSWTLEIEESW